MLIVIALVLVAAASALAAWRWPIRWAQALIWVLVLQNVVVITVWKVTGSGTLALDLLYAKEVIIAGGSVVAVVLAARLAQAGRLPAVVWIAVAFGVLCALWVPISYARHEGIEQIARGLRSLVYPVLLLVLGVTAVTGLRAAIALRGTLWWTAIVLGASAIIERTFIPLHFWISIDLEQYWVGVRGLSGAMLNGGLPWNFYVPIPLLGSTVRRAFGIMTDPLGLSYYLILPLALAVAEIWKARATSERASRVALLAAVMSALGITFSLSRLPIAVAGLLTVAAPVLALGIARDRWRPAFGWAAASGAAFAVALLLSVAATPKVGPSDLVQARAPVNTGSEGGHVASVVRATSSPNPLFFGRGLGTAGYLSSKFAETGANIGYENPYLDAAAQVGLPGGLLLAALLVVTTIQLLRARGRAIALTLPTGATMGLLAVGGFVSGQLEVITSLGATWLFAGVTLSVGVITAAAWRPASAEAGDPGAPVPDIPSHSPR